MSVHAFIQASKDQIREITLSISQKPHLSWEVHGASQPLLQLIEKWFKQYLDGREPTVKLPITLEFVPEFTRKVFLELQNVPFGRSLTYQDLARLVGNPKAPRAVGQALGRNPLPLIIPCHRVLASGNQLGGFSCGLPIKRALLHFEKIKYAL